MSLPSSNILSCPNPTTQVLQDVVSTVCIRKSDGASANNRQCERRPTRFEYRQITTQKLVTVKTPCGAFNDGFNYTTSILASFFVPMLLTIICIRLMKFAGEDG